MIKQPIKVMVKLNNDDNIIDINSNIFLENNETYIIIDEGLGDKYAHAQGLYLPDSIIKDDGSYRYKLKSGKIIENK